MFYFYIIMENEMVKNSIFFTDLTARYQKKISTILLLLMLHVFACFANAQERLYMMPYEQVNALKDLIGSIAKAQKSINISIYSFTNREIAKALRDASSRGVKINIIYDMSQKDTSNSTIGYLEKFANIHTCLLEGRAAKNGKYKGIMHQKMIIIDDNLIGLGSANWSKNAFENSYETLYFTQSADIITKANEYYNKMLKSCKPFIKY